MQPRDDFESFCREIGCEPTDERFVFWMAALASTRNQPPVAYAPLVAGVPVGVLDAIRPGMKNVIPLYAAPVANVPKPPLNRQAAEMVLRNYEGDAEGLAGFFHRYYCGD